MKLKDNKVLTWLRRYFPVPTLLVLGVVVYLTVFSENSVMQATQYKRIIDSLQTQIDMNTDSMLYFRRLNERLQSDPDLLEKVVREQYNMKRPEEDVYVVK